MALNTKTARLVARHLSFQLTDNKQNIAPIDVYLIKKLIDLKMENIAVVYAAYFIKNPILVNRSKKNMGSGVSVNCAKRFGGCQQKEKNG